MSRLRGFLFGTGEGSPGVCLGLLVLRVSLGLTLAFAHGLNKIPPSGGLISKSGEMGFPLPELFAWVAGLSEFVGGMLLAVGFLTRPAALAVFSTMAVAFFLAHSGDPFSDRELAFAYGMMALALLASGAGAYSVDARIARRQRLRA